MATILRTWSYRYQWLYDTIARLTALSVGGEAQFRQLALKGLTIAPETQVLDVCCGWGQSTYFLAQRSHHVTGLDASPRSLAAARRAVPQATYVEAWAEAMPFSDRQFDLVHTSVALHEMEAPQLQQILQEVHRVLKPGGWFTLVDLHQPTNPLVLPGLSMFLWLFETHTAWALLHTDLVDLLTTIGFQCRQPVLYAGGSLQVIQAQR
jgi:demethylmenaquinone methyltransferase/2-methoxy-6-polyprenyl-1,4-benzoquinol methylase